MPGSQSGGPSRSNPRGAHDNRPRPTDSRMALRDRSRRLRTRLDNPQDPQRKQGGRRVRLASFLLIVSAFASLYVLVKNPAMLTYFLTGQGVFGLLLLTFAMAMGKRKGQP